MIRGMRYSPVAGSLSVSIRIVSAVFIAEFQAMLAMYMKSVSMEYGSPFHALAMTMCIRPGAAIGASQEKALSMRKGWPDASMIRSSGESGYPSGTPGNDFPGTTCSGRPAGLGPGGAGFGCGDL